MIAEKSIADPSKPDLRPVLKRLDVAASGDTIVLVHPDVGPRDRAFANLVRRDARQGVVWTAELPESADGSYDCYVEAHWDDGSLAANTWQGEYVRLDPATGRIQSREFVK